MTGGSGDVLCGGATRFRAHNTSERYRGRLR